MITLKCREWGNKKALKEEIYSLTFDLIAARAANRALQEELRRSREALQEARHRPPPTTSTAWRELYHEQLARSGKLEIRILNLAGELSRERDAAAGMRERLSEFDMLHDRCPLMEDK